MKILQNQQNIKDALTQLNCNENNLVDNKVAFDVCAFYMAQMGEAAQLLTDETKSSQVILLDYHK